MVWRRRNYLINKEFQFRYIGRILFGILLMALVIAFTVYYTTWARIMDAFYNIPQIAAQYAQLFASVNGTLLLVLIGFLAVTAVFSVFISHAIAGPIYRFQKAMESLAAGDLTLRIGLRKHDEFKTLASSINQVVTVLRHDVGADLTLVQELAVLSEKLSAAGASGPVKEVQDLVVKLQTNLRRYKLEATETV